MKTSSILTAMTAAVGIMSAASAYAAPTATYTMTGAVVTQKMSVSGCAAVKSAGLADVTFYDDKTFKIDRLDDAAVPGSGFTVYGTYATVPASSSYTVYMSLDNDVNTPDPSQPVPPGIGLPKLLDSLDILAKKTCGDKYTTPNPNTPPGGTLGETVKIVQPSILIKKSTMVVKNSTKSATLTLQMKGKSTNSFKLGKDGQPVPKVGSQSSTITLKGTVVEASGCEAGACSIATTVTM